MKSMNTKLIVGEYYSVPTIRDIPILLPAHTDTEICVINGHNEHYHVDWRFLPFKPDLLDVTRKTNHPIIYKELVCILDRFPKHPGLLLATLQLILQYRDRRVIDGKCPHKGVCIDPYTGQCPAHGLRWDLKTGELIWKDSKLTLRIKGTDLSCEGKDTYNEIISDRTILSPIIVELCADGEPISEHVFKGSTHLDPEDKLIVKC